MPSLTLAQSALLSQDKLVKGVIASIITVDKFFEVLPFQGIEGNSLAYDRELVLGDVQMAAVGDTIAAKNPTTVAQVTSALTSILGDAEVNGLIQATRSNINDQTGIQVAGKAKSAGRQFRNLLINGDGVAPNFAGLLGLVAAGQTISAGVNGAPLSFDLLDQLLDSVVDKDGQVDYIQMHSRTLRSYYALLRAQGGAQIGETMKLPSGAEVPMYRSTPIFRNDYLPINQTQGTSTTCTTILAGTLDDGSQKYGVSGLTAQNAAGINVEYVGVHQTRDEKIYRVKWYCGLANFNQLGLAAVKGITN
jgi:hypothetical protein